MSEEIYITPEAVTSRSFEPFGMLLRSGSQDTTFRGRGSEGWSVDLVAERPQLLMLHYRHQPVVIEVVERHLAVTQAAVPLGGASYILVVAEPASDATERQLDPRNWKERTTFRAFVFDGVTGYMLHRNVWHAVDRYPLSDKGADFVLITDGKTTDELVGQASQPGMCLTETIDLRHMGFAIRVCGFS